MEPNSFSKSILISSILLVLMVSPICRAIISPSLTPTRYFRYSLRFTRPRLIPDIFTHFLISYLFYFLNLLLIMFVNSLVRNVLQLVCECKIIAKTKSKIRKNRLRQRPFQRIQQNQRFRSNESNESNRRK